MLVYTHQTSKKTRKQKQKQKLAVAKWKDKYGVTKERKVFTVLKSPTITVRPGGMDFRSVGSASAALDTFKRTAQKYTGDKVLGIATMHKSNAVPIFSNDEAVEVSKMRRG
jgi:hypothetical protein